MVKIEFQNNVRNMLFYVGNSFLEAAVIEVDTMDLLPIKIINHYIEQRIMKSA